MSDILTMGKIDANKVILNLRKVNVNKFLTNYLKESYHKNWNNRNIEIELSKEECYALLDLKLMNHILINLINNAVKYSESDSKITLRSKIDGKQVHIEVEDCGFGISESDLPFIFDSFYRAKAVENITGTGLGMSIVKLFVEKNNGEIYVESTLNVGTKVTLIFSQV